MSDGNGAYQFTRLVPGTYSVKGELQGFRAVMQENVTVNADRTSRADLRLEVGDLAEMITVAGDSPLLDTTSALNQTVMSREVLDTLPVPNDIFSMARLAPGLILNKYDVGGRDMIGQSRTMAYRSREDEYAKIAAALDPQSHGHWRRYRSRRHADTDRGRGHDDRQVRRESRIKSAFQN